LPGPTFSEGAGDFIESLAKEQGKSVKEVEKDFFQHMRPTSILQRFASPDEIASLVTFVASPLSSATNGAALRADGGVVKGIL
ncbi:MAG TPA: SDR family oxidoreductase, partial [Mucilaginibacter sp.]